MDDEESGAALPEGGADRWDGFFDGSEAAVNGRAIACGQFGQALGQIMMRLHETRQGLSKAEKEGLLGRPEHLRPAWLA